MRRRVTNVNTSAGGRRAGAGNRASDNFGGFFSRLYGPNQGMTRARTAGVGKAKSNG